MLILKGNADHRIFRFGDEVTHEEQTFHDMQGLKKAANERLAKKVGHKLSQTYPGHPWGVSAEIEHGIVRVCLQGFAQWPYVIHIATLKSDPGMRCVVEAGGHILERLRMPRKGFSLADYLTANQAMPSHFFRNQKAPE